MPIWGLRHPKLASQLACGRLKQQAGQFPSTLSTLPQPQPGLCPSNTDEHLRGLGSASSRAEAAAA